MKISKHTVDKLVALAAAAATPVVTILVDTHTIAPRTGVDLGALVVALVGGYHSGAVAQKRGSAPALRPLDTP